MVLDVGKGVEALLFGEHLAEIVDAQFGRKLGGLGGLVELVAAVRRLKPDREGVVGHQAGRDIAGIDAAREEGPHLDVADAVRRHRLAHPRVDLLGTFVKVLGGFVAEIGVPVALDVQLAVFVGEPVGGGQLVGTFEKGLVHRAVLESQVGAQRFGVHLAPEPGVFQQALDLRAEQQFAGLGLGVVERLDAEHIARAVHRAGLGVVHHKGEHAAQHRRQFGAVFFKPVQDDLGIAAGLKDVAARFQLGAQVHKVVNFAVEHADDGAVLVIHRLAAGRQVNDAQPAEAQRHRVGGGLAAQVVALHIGPAVDDAVRHLVQDRLAPFAQAGKTNKATHGRFVLSLVPTFLIRVNRQIAILLYSTTALKK